MTPENGGSPSHADIETEIETLRKQLAQAHKALSESAQTLQRKAAQESQINTLRELVHKQQGDYDLAMKEFREWEKVWEREQQQANLERQRVWEKERQKEFQDWAEKQRVWEEKNRREWEEKQRAWEEKSRKDLWEWEQVWNEELEKKQRVWEDQKRQEQEARKRDLDKTKRELGNQVQEVRQAQQQQQQLADSLAKENERLMQRGCTAWPIQ